MEWRLEVRFSRIELSKRPADHTSVLGPLLPQRYAPRRDTGAGLQAVYLTRLTEDFALARVHLIGAETRALVYAAARASTEGVDTAIGLVQWEECALQLVQNDHSVTETERQAIVLARRGQGLFKERVVELEPACRITRVSREEHSRASHCKPWRDATNEERLDGENGLLLTPTIDHLFDRGFISFENNGLVIVSPVAHTDSLRRMGVDPMSPPRVGAFSEGQRRYLDHHPDNVLLKSRFLDHV